MKQILHHHQEFVYTAGLLYTFNCDTVLLFYLSLSPPPPTTHHTHTHNDIKYKISKDIIIIVQIAACDEVGRLVTKPDCVASNRHREAPVIPRGKIGIRRPETASSPHRLHLVTRALALSPTDFCCRLPSVLGSSAVIQPVTR